MGMKQVEREIDLLPFVWVRNMWRFMSLHGGDWNEFKFI
jgi:hypothetical protein